MLKYKLNKTAIPKLIHFTDRLCAGVARWAIWLNVAIMAIIVFDVISRRFFGTGSVMLQELEWHFHALLFLLMLAYALQKDAHVRVDIFYSRLSHYGKAWVDLLGSLFFLIPFAVMMVVLSFQFALRAFDIHEVSNAPGGLPYRWIIKSSLCFGFTLLLLQSLALMFRNILVITKSDLLTLFPAGTDDST